MTWLPIDTAASTILDLVNGNLKVDADLVYHVVHPQSFHWTRDLLPSLAAAGLKFEVVPTMEWMERFRKSSRDPKVNPPIKLLDWFESKYGTGATSGRKEPLQYFTDQTKDHSTSLRDAQSVTDVAYIRRIVDRFNRHWSAA